MKRLDVQDSIENIDELESTKAELLGLTTSIWSNEWALETVSAELKEKGKLTLTMACTLIVSMDKIYEDKSKFNQMPKKDQEFLELSVNNWRWERLSENSSKYKKQIKSQIELISKLL